MSNEWYNPYDPNIQWGNGLADLIDAFGPQLKKLLGGGGKKAAPAGPGGPGMPFQGGGAEGETMNLGGGSPAGPAGFGGAQGETMGGGSPAQFIGGQGGGGQMSPDVMRILAAIMQAMGGRPNI